MLVVNSALVIVMLASPVLTLRDANWVGPRSTMRIVVSALLKGFFISFAARPANNVQRIFFPRSAADMIAPNVTDVSDPPTVVMARYITMPAFFVALLALVVFFRAVEHEFRWTFYGRDTQRTMHRRHWTQAVGRPEADEDHAALLLFQFHYVSDLACSWIEQKAPTWQGVRAPTWCTTEWRKAVEKTLWEHTHDHKHREAACRALAAMRGANAQIEGGSVGVAKDGPTEGGAETGDGAGGEDRAQ
jgi:hypothetical protein